MNKFKVRVKLNRAYAQKYMRKNIKFSCHQDILNFSPVSMDSSQRNKMACLGIDSFIHGSHVAECVGLAEVGLAAIGGLQGTELREVVNLRREVGTRCWVNLKAKPKVCGKASA